MLDVASRTWGDGGGKTRRHEIGFVSYADRMTGCAIDGEIIRFGPEGPEMAWDLHRGKHVPREQQVVDKAAQATDSEVREFLRWVAAQDDGGTLPFEHESAGHRVHPVPDDLTALDFIEAIRDRQVLCTCATTDVRDCPNYQPGDEDIDDSE